MRTIAHWVAGKYYEGHPIGRFAVENPGTGEVEAELLQASDRPTMIHIETDLYGPNPPGSSWWDVPVSGVSELESTQRAYEEYLRDRKPQRHYL